MVSEDISHVGLLQELQPLMEVLRSLFSKFPGLSLQLGAKELKGEEETVLGVWVRESPHNYENNMRINEVGSDCRIDAKKKTQPTTRHFMTRFIIAQWGFINVSPDNEPVGNTFIHFFSAIL